ncbi:MAG: SAM-dependent methyltransferase [Planctomycetes bacterium]|nr:SAM-dependent methyltransferase [Planctomycetota bacterium]
MESNQLTLFDEYSEPLSDFSPVSKRIDVFAKFRYKAKPYCKRNWGNSLHSLCSYQGKLKPAIAHFLIKTMTNQGDRILDPFSGAGTIPLEACLQARFGHGVDINPLAHVNTLAKVTFPSHEAIYDFRNRLSRYIDQYLVAESELTQVQLNNINGRLQDYFHPDTFAEIVTARKFFSTIDQHTPASAFVESCLLHILHGNRPYALSRRSHGLTPFSPTGPFKYKQLLSHLDAKIQRAMRAQMPKSYVHGSAYLCSVFDFMAEQQYDAIITSPPFLNSTRFYIANWIRLWFCGWEKNDFKPTKRGDYLEEMQAKSITVYEKVFLKFLNLLKPGGLCVLHLGVKGRRDMGKELIPQAEKTGFEVLRLLYEDVSLCENHGVRDQGSTNKHQFLFLQAPTFISK